MLEQRYQKSLWKIFSRALEHLGLKNQIHFFPSTNTDPQQNLNVAPCAFSTRTPQSFRAQVHDDNAYFMGGLSGQAGLFGTLESMATYAHQILWALKNPNSKIRHELSYFIKNFIGFDRREGHGAVKYFFHRTFGHYGYTGTSLWIDPTSETVAIILANRVFYSTDPQKIFWLRNKVHQLVAKALLT